MAGFLVIKIELVGGASKILLKAENITNLDSTQRPSRTENHSFGK